MIKKDNINKYEILLYCSIVICIILFVFTIVASAYGGDMHLPFLLLAVFISCVQWLGKSIKLRFIMFLFLIVTIVFAIGDMSIALARESVHADEFAKAAFLKGRYGEGPIYIGGKRLE